MRFYNLIITNPKTGAPILASVLGGLGITSLLPNGNPNPAALNIEFNIPFAAYATPVANAWLRIWGLGIQYIGAQTDLNDANIAIYAGMSKGLPLANPTQQGLLLKGRILQAWGNWIGTAQTLEMVFAPPSGSPDAPINVPFTWQKGTPLAVAISQTLSVAMPTMKQSINISPKLVLGFNEYGHYESAGQFANFINQRTKPIIGGTYPGVHIASDGDTVKVWDQTMSGTKPPKAISFADLIGQPTWIDLATISATMILRGDLSLSDVITMPDGLQTLTRTATVRTQDKPTFTGNYIINSINHYANFRQATADAWVTVIEATAEMKRGM